jgi:L-threonylcarbamoyladenylate synthase
MQNTHIVAWSDPATVGKATHLLQENKVILATSDTVLGLLAPVTAQGFETLNMIKGRFEKPYIVLIDSQDKLAHFAQLPLPNYAHEIIDRAWPGPLTIIVRAKDDLPAYARSKDGTIALRVPEHPQLRAVLSNFDGLFSTSANKAGCPVPDSFEFVDADIIQQVSCIIKNGAVGTTTPSTIIDCTGDTLRVVRQGAYREV